MSWHFIDAWTCAPDQDLTTDGRGWIRGRGRTHPEDIHKRIVTIRDALVADRTEFYIGDAAIQQEYEERYPADPVPSCDYITRILRAAHRTQPHRKKRRGTARYLAYPVQCVDRLGDRIAEVDFVQKFLRGVSEVLHFFSAVFQKPSKVRHILRTEAETTPEAITATMLTFKILGWPDVVRVDPGNVFSGRGERMDGKGQRTIPTYAQFLLEHRVIPVYGAIRSPWHQAHVEGSNSVFGRNFWHARIFTSRADVDDQLASFNICSLKRARWERSERVDPDASWVPRICFIRKVAEDPQTHKGWVPIAGTIVSVHRMYIGLFLFAEWNLHDETLTLFFEWEGVIRSLKHIQFPIHPLSKKRCTHFIV